MSSFVRQPVLYPVSAVFLDDSADFLHALRGIVPDGHLNRFFTRPREAFNFISSRAQASLPNRLSGADYSEFEKKGGSALGRDVLIDDARFEEVAAVVVDYEMPEIDGIEFLASIRGIACTKILLTGAAGETEAVDAFNAGLIDFYLKKTDAGMTRKLLSALAEAKARHCAQRGYISVHDVGSTYCDPRTLKALDEIVAREHIAEYYWRPEQDAVLMFDADGNPGLFLAWAEGDWRFQCGVLTDEGGAPQLLREMEARRVMPLFWPSQTYRAGLSDIRFESPVPIPDWPGAFYCWSRIDPREVDLDLQTCAQWRQRQTLGLYS
jgi:CheY-like chemotaxis protein